ncbi:MAG: hypothetical protein QHH00_03480 [Methanomassiliicoccales archaeon]|nr:hypothetical protein [Methanomassiliicoccales archaeon]
MQKSFKTRGLKITPKNLEKELIEKARKLADSPSILFPRCTSKCRKCSFEKILNKIEKISEFRDDTERLISFASWGDQLVRSYAATISLKNATKIPYLAFVDLPIGKISYAVRGKVDKEKLIGVQYFDDPELRLLAFWDIARKDNLYLYSSASGFFCSSDSPKVPMEYVRDSLQSAPYKLDDHGKCPHGSARMKLEILWKSAGLTISICMECLGEENLLHHLMKGIAGRDPASDFDVGISYEFECLSSCQVCRIKSSIEKGDVLYNDYLNGKIGDREFFERYLKEIVMRIQNRGDPTLVIGEKCFGSDIDTFVSHLRGTDAEKEALKGLLLKEKISVISTSDQAGKIIGELWDQYGKLLLEQVASPAVIDSILNRGSELSPAQMINEAKRLELANQVHALLPSYSSLGNIGRLADRLARIVKTQDREYLVKIIEKERQLDHRARAVTYAFLCVTNMADQKSWQYTNEEKNFGTYLADFAKELVTSEGEGYHEALARLIAATGSIEELVREERK